MKNKRILFQSQNKSLVKLTRSVTRSEPSVFHMYKMRRFYLIVRFYDPHSDIKIYDYMTLPFILGHTVS